MLYTFTVGLRQTPLNADLEKLSSSALQSSCLVPYIISEFSNISYICSFKDIASYKVTKIRLDKGELPVNSSSA